MSRYKILKLKIKVRDKIKIKIPIKTSNIVKNVKIILFESRFGFYQTVVLRRISVFGISTCAPWQAYLLIEKLFDIPVFIFLSDF